MSDIQKQPDADALIEGLPAVIAVPDGDDGPIYRPLLGPNGATLWELRLAIEALWACSDDDLNKSIVLTRLMIQARQAGAEEDTRLSEVLLHPGGDKK